VNVGHLAPEIALVVGAVAVLLVASFTSPRRQWMGAALAGVATLASAGITIGLAVTTESQLTFERSWALDPVTHASELIILGATGCCLLLVPEWFRTDARRGELPAIVLFAATGAMLLAGAADTMEIVVGVLLVSVTGYTLAAFHRGSPAAVEAGMKYFLVGALANAVLLVGVVILYGSAGSTNLADIGVRLRDGGDRVALTAAVVCIVVGLAFEIGAVPVHTWVPDVAQAGPVPSAAFLTVVPKVGAVVALARVVHVLPDDAVAWRPVIALVAGVTMTLGNLIALWQDDLRRLLGWSTVSQAGYALIAVVVIDRSDAAPMALVAFLAAYSAANVAAFGVVAELRGRTHLTGYRGLAGTHPWLALSLAVSLLSLVGIPPLGGFVGKLTLFTAAIDGGYGWLAALAVANTVVSLFYYLRVIGPMYFDRAERPVPVLGRAAAVGAGLATLAVVALGVAAEPVLAGLDGVRLLP
jgi:NADH-quinone oxidoreductase subunit N